MNIAITGDKGFVGSRLKKDLEREGFCISVFNEKKYDFFNVDSLKKFVSNKDVIIHLAAVNRGTNKEIIAGNVCLTYNLLRAVKKFKSKAKIIYSSSIQAEIDSVYGLSKRLAEIILKDFSEELQIPVTIFRITNIFGERCRPFYNSAVATFCYQAVHNKKLSIQSGSGNKEIQLIYVEEVIKNIIKEIKTRRKNLFFLKYIASDNKITVEKLAQLINSFKKINLKKKNQTFHSNFYKDLYNTYNWYAKHPNWPCN